ncbi:EF-hand calcium-binding domain-containing protein 1-like [Belonocnema kinseyi]|uniref:EF-hand calcium-binding domain-containing protein 1-like n=1 Tax=Belonocnema kinseyi TaxID=2817044 RepID=UPI00143CF3AA|nr:EF-hand calcium-binding domain-containing protein 1-like [Belonocnema kinseyi]
MPKEPPIDLLNNSLKEIVFRRKNAKLFKKLAQITHFNLWEVEALALINRKITQEMGPVTRTSFRDVVHSGFDYTENIRHLLVDKVFSIVDKKSTSVLSADQWVEGLSIMIRGTLDERIDFAYKVYDFMKVNRLKKEQIFPMMRGCLIMPHREEDSDEMVKDLIELLLKKLDVDRNGKVSKKEYTYSVKEMNELVLECMGPVFPTREAIHAFLTTFTTKTHRF